MCDEELNTLLTALYVLVDDNVAAPRTGRGRQPLLSDSELVTLAVAQVLLGYHCERRWVRHIRASPQWPAMSPICPAAWLPQAAQSRPPLLCKAITTIAACCPSCFDDLWMTDATPVPCGAPRETVTVVVALNAQLLRRVDHTGRP